MHNFPQPLSHPGKTAARHGLEAIRRVVFPPRCGGCGLWCEELFCSACRLEIKPIRAPLCAMCGEAFDPRARVLPTSICSRCRENRYDASPVLAALRSPYEYSGPVREVIHDFKYHGKTARSSQLGALLAEYLTSANEAGNLNLQKVSYIVPVPLHPWRQWRRGYNQSTLLAKELALWLHAASGQPIAVAEILRRVRYTTPQIELSGQEREQNMKGAFALAEARWQEYSGGTVLLVDDVTTTGATLFECARVLQSSAGLKAEQIFAVTLARAGRAY